MKDKFFKMITTSFLTLLCSCSPSQEALDRYEYMEMSPAEKAYTDMTAGLSQDQQVLTEQYRSQVEDFFDNYPQPPMREDHLLEDVIVANRQGAEYFYTFRSLTPPEHMEELHVQVADVMDAMAGLFETMATHLEENGSPSATQEEILALIEELQEEFEVFFDEFDDVCDEFEETLGLKLG